MESLLFALKVMKANQELIWDLDDIQKKANKRKPWWVRLFSGQEKKK